MGTNQSRGIWETLDDPEADERVRKAFLALVCDGSGLLFFCLFPSPGWCCCCFVLVG